MKNFTKIIFILWFTNCALMQVAVSKQRLRIGDFVLLPLNCYACRVISDESGSPYSHMGIVMEINDDEIILAESLGTVKLTTLKKFYMQKIPEIEMGFFRSREWSDVYSRSKTAYSNLIIQLKRSFFKDYQGLPYDDKFLWNNFDVQGNEKLYCSEFITKLVNPFLKDKIGTHGMNYLKNWDFWVKYLRGTPPQGKKGNNPSFFTDKKKFIQIFPSF